MSDGTSELVVKGEAIESDSGEELVHDFKPNTHSIVSSKLLFLTSWKLRNAHNKP